MRRHVFSIGCVSMGLTLSLLGSPLAQADDASFVRDAKALGFLQASSNLISTAESACYLLGPRHRDPAQVEYRVARYTVVNPDQAHKFVLLAVDEYCPENAGLVGA